MKRRSFLGLLGGAVVAPAVDVDAKPIRSTPPSAGYSYNQSITAHFGPIVERNLRAGDHFTIEGNARTFEVVA